VLVSIQFNFSFNFVDYFCLFDVSLKLCHSKWKIKCFIKLKLFVFEYHINWYIFGIIIKIKVWLIFAINSEISLKYVKNESEICLYNAAVSHELFLSFPWNSYFWNVVVLFIFLKVKAELTFPSNLRLLETLNNIFKVFVELSVENEFNDAV
jgi:hypothetical protein